MEELLTLVYVLLLVYLLLHLPQVPGLIQSLGQFSRRQVAVLEGQPS